MTYEKPVLIVVDMQNGFVNDHSRHIVPLVVELVKKWPGDIVFTKFINAPGSLYERLIGWHRMQQPPETDLIAELQPYASSVFEKNGYTYFNSEGAETAAERGWKEIVICGVATDGCVLKSAVDAFELGYTPFIVEDACASHAGVRAHEAGVYLAGRFIGRGQLIRSGDVLVESMEFEAGSRSRLRQQAG